MEEEKIEVVIEGSIDTASFQKGVQVARDTGKAIDQQLRTELKLDVLRFEDAVAKVKRQLKEDIPEERRTELRLEQQDLKAGLTEARRQLKNLENTGDKTTSRLQSKFNKLGGGIKGSFKSIGKTIVGFLSLDLFRRFGKNLLNLGSDAEESASKFATVFGDAEKAATNAFNGIADAVGRSRLEITQFGAGIGDILKPLGFAETEALQLSENMTKLALDVASFNNVSDAQVINSFTSALTGERESLKSLGIVISEADVKQKAYTTGLAEQGAELTKQQKALATYQLLLENTSDAQGDALRTAGGFANQLKRLQGAVKDAFAEAGQSIAGDTASILESLSSFVKNYGAALITTAVETVKTIGGILNQAAQGFVAVFDVLSGETQKAGQEQANSAKSIGLLFLSIQAGFQLTAQIIRSVGIFIADTFVGISQRGQALGQLLVAVFRDSFSAVGELGFALGANLRARINNIFSSAVDTINGFIEKINSLGIIELGTISGPAKQEVRSIKAAFGEAFSESKRLADRAIAIDKALPSFSDTFSDIGQGFTDVFTDITIASNKLNKEFSAGAGEVENAYDDSFSDISGLLDKFSGDAGQSGTKAARGLGKATDGLKDVEKTLKSIEDQSQKTFDNVVDSIDDSVSAIDELDNKLSDLDDELTNLSADTATDLSDRFLDIQEDIKGVNDEISELESAQITPEGEQDLIRLREELAALTQEGELARQGLVGIGEAEGIDDFAQKAIDSQQAIREESDTERILREASDKEREIQGEIDAVRQQKIEELMILQDFFTQAERQSQAFAKNFAESLQLPLETLANISALTSNISPALAGTNIGGNIGTNVSNSIANNVNSNNTTDARQFVFNQTGGDTINDILNQQTSG